MRTCAKAATLADRGQPTPPLAPDSGEHKADRNYPIVSAASIVAKVTRDKTVADLREEYGDFGTGYLTDEKTTQFLTNWLTTHQDYPDCVRKSWKPAKRAKNEQGTTQMKLG